MPGHSEMRQLIGAREHAAGGISDARAVRPDIRALVMKEFVVDGDEMSIPIYRRTYPMSLLA